MKKYLKLIMIGLSAMMLTACGRTEINVNDYFSAKAEGANGKGKVTGELNTLALVQGNRDAFGVSTNASEAELRGVVDTINSNIDGEFDKKEGVSNGDTISFIWDTSRIETIESAYKNVKLVTEDKTVTVSGLKEIESFNPFDYLEAKFIRRKGQEDTIQLEFNVLDTMPFKLDFRSNEKAKEKIQCGQTIKITPARIYYGKVTEGDALKEFLAEKGYELTEYEMEVTVPDSLDEIPIVD